jgi:hypothetical protein
LHFAHTAYAAQGLAVINDGNTGGVITSVFKAAKAFDKNVYNITLRDSANNSTHIIFLRWALR